MEPIVRKVDHVFVPVKDPEPLFSLFTKDLGLPVSWPINDYGAFRSGGVSLGNMNIEFVTGDPGVVEYFEPWLPATVRGVAFEPVSIEQSMKNLADRDLPHGEPMPFEAPDGGLLWTNIPIGGMVGRGALVFLCRYHNEEVRSSTAADMFHESGGGPLGITGVDELFTGVSDFEKAERRWTALLAPVEPVEPGRWKLPEGPGIRVQPASRDAVHGIAVRVRSLEATRAALEERGLLGNVKRHSIGLDYPATFGLDVWFVE